MVANAANKRGISCTLACNLDSAGELTKSNAMRTPWLLCHEAGCRKMIGHHDLEHCFIKFADCQWLNAVSDIFECEAELQNLLNIYRPEEWRAGTNLVVQDIPQQLEVSKSKSPYVSMNRKILCSFPPEKAESDDVVCFSKNSWSIASHA